MTIDEICKEIGLKSPDEFDEFESSKIHRVPYPRASGRTTKMLLNVLLCIQKGDKAAVFVANMDHQQMLRRQFEHWCDILGFDAKLVEFIPIKRGPDYSRGRESEWFYDHYALGIR